MNDLQTICPRSETLSSEAPKGVTAARKRAIRAIAQGCYRVPALNFIPERDWLPTPDKVPSGRSAVAA